MQFNGFKKEAIEFLKRLKKNNTKEWFEANRSSYEKYILNPNRAYVQEMGEYLQILVPNINAIPKINHSLFKIYRDSRFHQVAPIKERIGIILWQGAGHRMQSSSFYMHYDDKEYFISAGIRNFKAPLLAKYREFIKDSKEREELHQIFQKLLSLGYKLPEPKFKRFPRGFNKEDKHSYLYLMGAIYAYKTYPIDDTFFSQKIIDRNFKIYQDLYKLQQWVHRLVIKN